MSLVFGPKAALAACSVELAPKGTIVSGCGEDLLSDREGYSFCFQIVAERRLQRK